MTPDAIRSAIMNTFCSSMATLAPIEKPNHPFLDPRPKSLWLRPRILMGSSFVGELGEGGVGVRTGSVFCSIFDMPGNGLLASNAAADRIEKTFRKKDVGGVRFKEPSTNDHGLDPNGYNNVVVTIDFDTWIGES